MERTERDKLKMARRTGVPEQDHQDRTPVQDFQDRLPVFSDCETINEKWYLTYVCKPYSRLLLWAPEPGFQRGAAKGGKSEN
jgi:hypothetical protein